MFKIDKFPYRPFKCYTSVWDPTYQKELINSESSRHDWHIDLGINYARIIAANNHKFDLHFSRDLDHVSCSCKRFIDDGLNWCQHLSALHRFKATNYSEFSKLNHVKKPELVFYNSQTEVFFLPSGKKEIKPNKLDLFDAQHKVASISNINTSVKEIGFTPDPINPFSQIQTYQYQDTAIKHMLYHKRTILSLEMGWGKTLCALICTKHLLDLNPNIQILIVCPKSLKSQWEKEIGRFLPGTTVQNVKSNKALLNQSTFTIVNYEMARDYPLNTFYDVIIMDEVQKIKNKATKAWKAIARLKSEWCWALSGTVVENNVEDFLSIADILRPELFKTRWKFYDKFCETERTFVKGFKNSDDLKLLLSEIIYRAPDGDNPLKLNLNEAVITLGMKPEQKDLHDRYYSEVRRLLAMSMNRPLSFAEQRMLSAFQTKARMASDSAMLLNPLSKEKSKKIESIVELIKNTNGKVVVFSEWKEFLNLIAAELVGLGISCVKFDGSLTLKQRKAILDLFINNAGIKVFLSTDSGGVGVDGLQAVSNTIIHGQMSWNPAKLEQRNGRLFRIGQKHDVQSHLFIAKDSIEESIVKTHLRKSKVKNVIFGKDEI